MGAGTTGPELGRRANSCAYETSPSTPGVAGHGVRVLTGSATVTEAKRGQVLAAIEELGYRTNRVARNLRRQQAQMIGVVIADIEKPHFSQMVRAVEDACRGPKPRSCWWPGLLLWTACYRS